MASTADTTPSHTPKEQQQSVARLSPCKSCQSWASRARLGSSVPTTEKRPAPMEVPGGSGVTQLQA